MKYSSLPSPEVIQTLLRRGISFIVRPGIQTRHRRVFFRCESRTAAEISAATGANLASEIDNWDFNGWNALKN